jgi:hypothetical protein
MEGYEYYNNIGHHHKNGLYQNFDMHLLITNLVDATSLA